MQLAAESFEIPRTRKRMRQLPLIPMVDVVFMLIVFFMLTTSFMKVESMELLLPSSSSKTAESKNLVRIHIEGDGRMIYGQRTVNEEELRQTLETVFNTEPNMRIMILTASGVSMQRLVSVMDTVYLAGGKSLFVREWKRGKEAH